MMASSSVSRILTSPIHIIKLRNYGDGIDRRGAIELAKVLEGKDRRNESGRSFKGRKISNFVKNIVVKDELSAWDKVRKLWPVNIIPNGAGYEILRPEVKFSSNARPALLKWRQLEYEATQILPTSGKQTYKDRMKKKYSSTVPIHAGHARRLVDDQEPSTFKRSHPPYPGSSLTWLPAQSYGNGLPQTILHLRYPLKMRQLNSVEEDKNGGVKDVVEI